MLVYLKFLFCFSDDYQGHRRDGASEDVPESKRRVTFALTIMDRGEGRTYVSWVKSERNGGG